MVQKCVCWRELIERQMFLLVYDVTMKAVSTWPSPPNLPPSSPLLVLHGQTLFHTEGRGQGLVSCGPGSWPRETSPGHGHRVTSCPGITKVRLATFLPSQFWFLQCSSSWLKTLHAQLTSPASSLLHWTEILNFPVNHIKLLYGHVPDPFPLCRMGSGLTPSLPPSPADHTIFSQIPIKLLYGPLLSVRNGVYPCKTNPLPPSWSCRP